ncbi:MAG: tetratricopeptide repeat protein [Myxococcota bacterium]
MSGRDAAKAAVGRGRVLAKAKDVQGAIAAYREAVAADPTFAVAHNALGVALSRAGDLAASERALLEATKANPRWADPWVNLGRQRMRAGDKEGAAQAWQCAVERGGDDEARLDLYRVLRTLDRPTEAAAALRPVADPPVEDLLWLGKFYASREKYETAIPLLQRACAALNEHADAHYALGVALQRTHRLDASERAFRHCAALDPRHAEAWNNLGNVLRAQVRFDEAADAYETALTVRPDKANTHRNLLFALQYDPERTAEDVYLAHKAFGERFAAPLPATPIDRRTNRPLRIGLVSADFGHHPVGYFLSPVLEHLDKSKFTVIAYAGPRPADDLRERLRDRCDQWVPTDDLDDEALAARIREDAIDVLFDLGGHTRGSRVQVFARKPALVQVTWAGYVGTTGLPTMDYLLGDERHTPAGAERFTVERIWRMPRSYVCWEPPAAAPAPGPLPQLRKGHPTLGSMNNLSKLNRQVVALWSRILRERPDARLRLVTKSLGDPSMRDRWRAWFADEGVANDRIDMSGRVPREEVLRLYSDEIDLALDSFPYSGGLTTLEALWMGVPVVTRGDGDRFASRHSMAHLGAAGIEGFVARDPDDYVRIALRWLDDPDALARVRTSLRSSIRDSVLCDGPGFTREFENAVQGMWRDSMDAREPTGRSRSG